MSQPSTQGLYISNYSLPQLKLIPSLPQFVLNNSANVDLITNQILAVNQNANITVPNPVKDQGEEPLYVNAKQYSRILKRREARARLEAQGKIVKERKKYLHESRHLHALNRNRGEGGKFNAKDDKTKDESTSKPNHLHDFEQKAFGSNYDMLKRFPISILPAPGKMKSIVQKPLNKSCEEKLKCIETTIQRNSKPSTGTSDLTEPTNLIKLNLPPEIMAKLINGLVVNPFNNNNNNNNIDDNSANMNKKSSFKQLILLKDVAIKEEAELTNSTHI